LGEIRSTIDIMMERTRGMTLSEQEQRTLHREELQKRAKGFRMKLLADLANAEQILSALNDEPLEDRTLLEVLIWEELVRGLPVDKEILHHLDAMAFLPQAAKQGQPLADLRAAFKTGLKDAAEDRKKIVAREKKKLAAFGISGSAVIPRIPKESEAAADAQQLVEKYRGRLLGAAFVY